MSPELLERKTISFALFNLLLVAVVGVVLRSYPLVAIPFPSYKNLLHAHSHFAFGGWVMPVLLVLITRYFPELSAGIAFRHLRNITVLILFSAYGMLISFPYKGYAAVSISFSTLSIFASFYMAIVFWKAIAKTSHTVSVRFLKAGLFFLVLSSLGPFATAPLIAMGKAGTAIYFNVIYFYLHFQYNGWFTFAVLAVLYKILEKKNSGINGSKVYYLNVVACIPAYFLSTLWSHPHPIFYVFATLAAILQMAGLFFLLKDCRQLQSRESYITSIFYVSLAAFALKNILQLLSAIPVIADLAYANRNFIIAYLHLVLLGFVSAFCLAAILHESAWKISNTFKRGIGAFFISFLITELLLVFSATTPSLQFAGFSYPLWLFVFSLLFPAAAVMIWYHGRRF